MKALVDKGHTVYAFDAPAHGRSSGHTINAIQYKNFVKLIYEKYGPFNGFISHSFGGLALGLALSELPTTSETRSVFIAPATETRTAINYFFNAVGITDAKVKALFDNIIIEKGGHPVDWFSLSRSIKSINGKILWIHDEEDSITPFSDALAIKNQNYSHVQFVITKGLGHRRIYRDEEVGKTIVNFF